MKTTDIQVNETFGNLMLTDDKRWITFTENGWNATYVSVGDLKNIITSYKDTSMNLFGEMPKIVGSLKLYYRNNYNPDQEPVYDCDQRVIKSKPSLFKTPIFQIGCQEIKNSTIKKILKEIS